MKQLICLTAFVAASLTMSINALADGTCAALTDEFTDLGPKPSVVIEYSSPIEFADGTTITKEALRKATTLTYSGNTYDVVVGNFDDASAITKLTFIVADYVTLSSQSRYTLNLPAFRYADDSSSAQSAGESIILKTATFLTIDATQDYTAPTSENYADNVIIASGTLYTANPTFCCKQLIIEPGAGLIIPSGRAVVVNDSLYVMTNTCTKNDLEAGFIINEGTLEVKGQTIVMRDISQNYGGAFYHTRYTSPIFGNTLSSMVLQDPALEVGYKSFAFHDLYGSSSIVWIYNNKTTTYTIDNYYNYAFVRNYYYSPSFLRFAGELNNTTINYGTLPDVYTGDEGDYHVCPIANPFDASLNLRALIDNDKLSGVRNLYTYRPLNRNSSVAYNVFSGLTTYDDADNMQKGYLLPPTSITMDYYNDNITYTADRDYVVVPDSIEALYESPVLFPYVRFAIDYDATSSRGQHGEGNREVVALYFITDTDVTDDSIQAHYDVYDTEDFGHTAGYAHFPAFKTWSTSARVDTAKSVKIAAMPAITPGTFDEDGYSITEAGTVNHSLCFYSEIVKEESTTQDTICITVLDNNLSDYNIKMVVTGVSGKTSGYNDVLTTGSVYTVSKYVAASTHFDLDVYYGWIQLTFSYTDNGYTAQDLMIDLGDDPTSYTAADVATAANPTYEAPSTQTYTSDEVASTPDDEDELAELIETGGDPDYVPGSTSIDAPEAETVVGHSYAIGVSGLTVAVRPASAEAYSYRLTDLSGHTVAAGEAQGEATVSAQAPGIYFLTLSGGETYKVALR